MDVLNLFKSSPENDTISMHYPIYKLIELTNDGNSLPKRVFVFHGKREEKGKPSMNEIFSDNELTYINSSSPEIIYSNQFIHKDDTIQTIKKKLVMEMDTATTSLQEIYLYSFIRDRLNLLQFFQEISKRDKFEFTHQMLGQLLCNLKVGVDTIEAVKSKGIKDTYVYEDIEHYFNLVDYNICHPIGQKFASFRDLLFSANPYDILKPNPESTTVALPVFVQTMQNSIQTFENHLLMNYGELVNNTIYFALAGDVIEYSINNRIDVGYVLSLYYPLLENQKILSKNDFITNHQRLIRETDESITEQTTKQYQLINMFHEVYYNKTGELPSMNRGITSFHVALHPETKSNLPLDAIFKNIHSTKFCPFIKYNPGPKRENIYRLYSEKISKSGKKIPYLKKSQIINLSKITGKVRQISVYNQSVLDGQSIEVFIDFDYNGNINVRCDIEKPILEDDILRILLGPVNKIISNLNSYLIQSGYKVNSFYSLRDNLLEFINLKYVFEMSYNKDFSLSKYKCLTGIFDIIDDNLRKGAILRFKRVDNFKKMDAIDATITELYKTTNDLATIVNALMLNYELTKDEALIQFQDYLNNFTRTKGRFVNKSLDIAENPGFPTILRVIPFEQRITVEVDKITGIDYISVLELYLESFLRITQSPDTIKLPIQEIKLMCLRETGQNIETQPVLITTAKPDVTEIYDEDSDIESSTDGEQSDGEDYIEGLAPIEDEDVDLEDAVNNAEDEDEVEEPENNINDDFDGAKYSDDESIQTLQAENLDDEDISIPPQNDDWLEHLETNDTEIPIKNSDESVEGLIESPDSYQGMEPLQDDSQPSTNSSDDSDSNLGMEPLQPSSESLESSEGMAPIQQESQPSSESLESSEGMAPIQPSAESTDSSEGMAPIQQESQPTSESLESSEGMAPLQQSSEESNQEPSTTPKKELIGGNKKKLFVDKLKRLEPNLILKKKEGKYDTYSRVCPANVSRQPVILTDEEKRKIDETHEGAYGYAMRYGSDPNKKNWYICPRYWCMTTNMPLTEQEVKEGKCADNMHEFTSKEHKNAKGEYIQYSPGFLPKDAHPKSCLPCCFKNAMSQLQITRRNQCNIQDEEFTGPNSTNEFKEADVDMIEEYKPNPKKPKAEEMDENPKFYIVSFDTYPIRKDRWGFLPPSVQLFLQVDYAKAITKKNAALIKPNINVFLRYGVEQSQHQSFLGSIAHIFGSVHKYRQQGKSIPTIQEIRGIISESLNLDNYLKLHNGSLISVFQPKKIQVETEVLNKHMQSKFYQSLNKSAEAQMDFYEDTVASFENFLAFLRDDDAWIDHTYLWDILATPNPNLFPNGLNLVIMEVSENDVTDNVELICPTNSYSDNLYDSRKETVLIMKKEEYYEPIYLYRIDSDEDIEGGKKIENSTITFHDRFEPTKNILNNIKHTTLRYCAAKPSMPNVYTYKKNISANELMKEIRNITTDTITILNQCINYRGKVIGINIIIGKKALFLPCFPSAILKYVPVAYMDNLNWNSYEWTRDMLLRISKASNKKILCEPMLKVVEEELIIGILTETNQFVQINPPIANDIEDGLPEYKSNSFADNGYIEADKALAVGRNPDITRTSTIKNITLESQFYSAFRSMLRSILNDFVNRKIRTFLVNILDDPSILYKIKLKKVQYVLEYLMNKQVVFEHLEPELLNELQDISVCGSSTGKCDDKKYCIMKDDICTLIIPQANLVSGEENKPIYYARLADELLRYKRIRLFLLEPRKYLNISNTDYKINETELILLQSILDGDYLDNLVPFQMNPYVKQITYDLAGPSVSQRYDLNITLEQQKTVHSEQTSSDSFIAECIHGKPIPIIGNDASYWVRTFPKEATEIIFHNSPLCTFYVIISIINDKFNKTYNVGVLKTILWNKYKEYMDKHAETILGILSLQGKTRIVTALQSNPHKLEDWIMSDDYSLTDLDLWMISSAIPLPIMLFSSGNLKSLSLSVNWLILGGNRNSDRYYCVRSPSIYNGSEPRYHLVKPAYLLRDLKGFDSMVSTGERALDYIENNLSLESYLETHHTRKLSMMTQVPVSNV